MSEDSNKNSKDYMNNEFKKELNIINKDLFEKANNLGIKNKKINNAKNTVLLIILVLITSLIVFILVFFSKLYDNNKKRKNNKIIKDEIICDYGFFLPEDDKTKCIKCSIENCNECFGTKLNNICTKCNPDLNPIYEDNKIILCSICYEG